MDTHVVPINLYQFFRQKIIIIGGVNANANALSDEIKIWIFLKLLWFFNFSWTKKLVAFYKIILDLFKKFKRFFHKNAVSGNNKLQKKIEHH